MVRDKCRQNFDEYKNHPITLHHITYRIVRMLSMDCTLQQLRPPVNFYSRFTQIRTVCVYVHSHRYTHVTTYSRQTDKQTEPNVFAMAHTISVCMCACIRQIQTHTHTHNSSENAQNTVTISINVQYVNCNRLQLFCCLFGSIREFPTYTHNVPTFPNISLCALFAPPGSW